MHLDSSLPCDTVAKVVHFDPNCVVCAAAPLYFRVVASIQRLPSVHSQHRHLLESTGVTHSRVLVGAKMRRGFLELASARFSKLANPALCKVVCLQTTTTRSHGLRNAAEQTDGRTDAAALDIFAESGCLSEAIFHLQLRSASMRRSRGPIDPTRSQEGSEPM